MVVNLRRRGRNENTVDSVECAVARYVTLDLIEYAVEQVTVSPVDFMNTQKVEPHSAVRNRLYYLATRKPAEISLAPFLLLAASAHMHEHVLSGWIVLYQCSQVFWRKQRMLVQPMRHADRLPSPQEVMF